MDPDAKVQIATMGTKLEYSTDDGTTWVRVYGLASTPEFGGQPNMIDSTTLDNTEYETSVLGLQSAPEISYEINVMALNATHTDREGHTVEPNLKLVKALADSKSINKWRLTKASGITFTYDAVTRIGYNSDEQASIEKFTIYHDMKSKITVALPG